MKVAIIYGWSEGEWHGKLLKKRLDEYGFTFTKDASQADIIIAHSGGCYKLPAKTKAQTIMLVGMPYWPGKHPMKSLQEKVIQETKDMWWFKKTFFNSYYLLSRPRKWYRMWRAWQQTTAPKPNEAANIIAVRNSNDNFVHPVESELLAKNSNWSMELLDGHHDDIWINPTSYIKLLQKTITK